MTTVPDLLTEKEVRAILAGGPVQVTMSSLVLFVTGDRMYKRDGSVFRLLSDRSYSNVEELTADG